MKKHILIITFAFGLLLNLSSCKKCDDPCDKRCDNYDPCCGLEPLTADFKYFEDPFFDAMLASAGLKRRLNEADTVLDSSPVLFRANIEDADEYIWKVGNDPREWNTREFRLDFRDVPSFTSIPITLTVRRKAGKKCFPNELEEITVTREMVVVRPMYAPILGKFEGYRKNYPNEKIVVEVASVSTSPFDPDPNLRPQIEWLTPLCGGKNLHEMRRYNGYRFLIFYTHDEARQSCCFRQRGYAWINEDGDLEVEYEYLPYPNPLAADSCKFDVNEALVKDYFIGKRIQ
jgi:hypothetical protein